MRISFSFLAISLLLFASSCSKVDVKVLEGDYDGTLKASYPNGVISIYPTELTLSGENYNSPPKSYGFPFGGTGVYQISDDKLIFLDKIQRSPNDAQTYVLTGTYRFTYKPTTKKLYFSATRDSILIEYEFKKN